LIQDQEIKPSNYGILLENANIPLKIKVTLNGLAVLDFLHKIQLSFQEDGTKMLKFGI